MFLRQVVKLKSAGGALYRAVRGTWVEWLSQSRFGRDAQAKAALIRQKVALLALIASKVKVEPGDDMVSLGYDSWTNHKSVFLITIPLRLGKFRFSEQMHRLLTKHVGMSLDSVNHWAVCVIDRGLGTCYSYDLMSDRLDLNAIGKNFFRVHEIRTRFVEKWTSCYYMGETTRPHEEIEQMGINMTALNPRYRLLSNNCQHLVENLIKELCNGKVISQAKLKEELTRAAPKIARDLLVVKLRDKVDDKGESEHSEGVKDHLDAIKRLWNRN